MKPLAFLDLETTGTDIVDDRIVEISVVIVDADLTTIHDQRTVLINPGMPIPPAATEIHKITDQMVADKPKFEQIAKSLSGFLLVCDLAGFNISQFDAPLLSEEFARCGIIWPEPGVLILDACSIFKKKERRDLSSALKFYCNEEHTDAHSGEADNNATIKVFRNQMNRYTDLQAMTRQELQVFCIGDALDLAGKIVKNEKGVPVYGFGKDVGKSVKKYPGFGKWMLKQKFPANTKAVIRKILGIV